MLCLCKRTEVRSYGSLINFRKTEFFQCSFKFVRCHIFSELTYKCRCYLCNNFLSGLHRTNQLENL